jgi:hypothetical protein
MHDLYREYGKILVNKHEDEDSYKYGVYANDVYDQAPPALTSSGWTKAPRIRLKKWKDVIKEKEWCCVSVIHLAHCEFITTFSIGRELVNLQELKIHDCSQLKEFSWTPDIVMEERQGVMRLCFVKLSFNRSLKILPDFSGCSKLKKLEIIGCSISVEPLHLHNCPSLKLLHITGKNAPEVRSLRSCPKLRLVQLAWKASHTGLSVENLPLLSKLMIAGPSLLRADSSYECIVPHGHNLFCQHYPEETVIYELTGIWELTNLKALHLNYLPLGCLPKGLGKVGSSLEYLNLRGCLLSQRLDFSEFPNLQYLSVAQTNMKELHGVGGLKNLEHLDCRFSFRLQKVSDLRPSARLKYVSLDQCPELQAIPRLPPRCCENPPESEDYHRLLLAVDAFVNTTKSAIPPRFFALDFRDRILDATSTTWESLTTEISEKLKKVVLTRVFPNTGVQHFNVECHGCMQEPLIGPRYKARPIRTTFDLCRKCLTNKCRRSDCNFTKNKTPGRYCGLKVIEMEYNLCHACFIESGCDERDFYLGIHETRT